METSTASNTINIIYNIVRAIVTLCSLATFVFGVLNVSLLLVGYISPDRVIRFLVPIIDDGISKVCSAGVTIVGGIVEGSYHSLNSVVSRLQDFAWLLNPGNFIRSGFRIRGETPFPYKAMLPIHAACTTSIIL